MPCLQNYLSMQPAFTNSLPTCQFDGPKLTPAETFFFSDGYFCSYVAFKEPQQLERFPFSLHSTELIWKLQDEL